MQHSVAPGAGSDRAALLSTGIPAFAIRRMRLGPAALAEIEFETMRTNFRPTGGIARVGEFVDLFRRQQGPTPFTLANWIERRQVIGFEWNDAIWLPWFQFHRTALVPHPQLAAVFAELNPVFDPWEVANWFAQPNSWLAGRIPVNTLLSDLQAVREAARADRYIANG